jgi:hypothetical protein
MFKISSNVKQFIEGYKDLIEQNNIKQLFEEAYDGWLNLNNMDVDELVDVLLEIGIDTEELRYELLYDKLSNMFATVLTLRKTQKNRSLHKCLLELLNNRFGFTLNEVVEFVKNYSLNFGVTLISVGRSPYSSNDYQIEFI